MNTHFRHRAGRHACYRRKADVIFGFALFGFANRMVTAFGLDYRAERDRAGSRSLAQGYVRR